MSHKNNPTATGTGQSDESNAITRLKPYARQQNSELPVPMPGDREVLLKISACGVCHTELDEIEGRSPPPRLPVIPGHQVVGRIEALGGRVDTLKIGQRVGVAWIFSACGQCRFCLSGRENLCADFVATGRDANYYRHDTGLAAGR